jgi:mannose-6-phosphate isomerase-like protein (cupin superfamily)
MHLTFHSALTMLAEKNAKITTPTRFVELFTHGTLSVEMYKPEYIDYQTPHDRDELYVIVSGTGEFINAGVRVQFSAGDVLFVPAGVEHRFENFTEDFATWVFFYGPVGGESEV